MIVEVKSLLKVPSILKLLTLFMFIRMQYTVFSVVCVDHTPAPWLESLAQLSYVSFNVSFFMFYIKPTFSHLV